MLAGLKKFRLEKHNNQNQWHIQDLDMRVIDYKTIPKLLSAEPKKIKRAMSKTLNTIGYDAIPKITEQAEQNLEFRRNARMALGFRVKRSTPVGKVEASVWSNRGWLYYHLNEGTRDAESGWKFNGRDYVLVPVLKKAFTVKGRMKKGFKSNLYVVPNGSGALVFYRNKRGEKNSTLIAVLKPQVRYHDELKPQEVINDLFIKKAGRLFNYYLDKTK